MSGSERFTLNAYCHCALLAAAGTLMPAYLCAQETPERPQLLLKAQNTSTPTVAQASGESVTAKILRARGID
ncbi:hypothetical protein, partial [Erwinia sp. MYb416]|uniref:hypothetical protein n=1 Tax=Erwinia sp. MYb416 TaxID=3108532 RepID=UPI0030997020